MSCECCQENEGIIDCKECSPTAGEWRVLCNDCSAFIHRGAYKNHQLISPETKKKRDSVKAKMVDYRSDREWEEHFLTHLNGVRKDVEERQTMYEDEIKKRITEIQQKLKQQGMAMISKIKELSSAKLEFLDTLSKQLTENIKKGKVTESTLDNLIANIGQFEQEMGSLDEDAIKEKLTYNLLEWEKDSFPKLSIPMRIDYSALEAAAEALKLDLVDDTENVKCEKVDAGPSDVSLQSRIDQQGVFWIHVDFKEDTLDRLLSISYDVRSRFMVDRAWKPYGQLGEKPSVGEMVYGLWNVDNKWYRGRVEVVTDSLATVVFLDFGNSEKIDYNNILPIGDRVVSDFPYQALECSLFPEPKEIPLNVKFEFMDMIAGGPLHCNILGKKMFGEKEITHIELIKDMPDCSQLNLREYLEERCASAKTKVDMPFMSRDIRLLENPNMFDKPKTSPSKNEEKDTKETKPEVENTEKAESGEAIKVETITVKEEKTEEAKKDGETEAMTNGTTEHVEEKNQSSAQVEEVDDVFHLPETNVNQGQHLLLHFDPRNHSLLRDGSFWATLHRTEEQNKEWERFQAKLNTDAESADHCAKINEGAIVLAQFKKNWHRAKIDQAEHERGDKKRIKVRLTDQGISCTITKEQLRVMPMKYLRVPSQAIKCTIACAKMSQFPSDSQAHFAKLVEGKVLTAQVSGISTSAKENCVEVGPTVDGEDGPLDILENLYERESNRTKRQQLADELPQGPGVIHLKQKKSDDEAWHDDFSLADPAYHVAPVPLVDDALVPNPDQHNEHYAQHPDVHVVHPPTDQYGTPYHDQYNSRGGEYRNDRRQYRNERGWRGTGDRARACFNCGDQNHLSKNCPTQANRPPQRRNRRN